jgi:hypothetical protein
MLRGATFSGIRRELTYKSDWYGKILVEVEQAFGTFDVSRR